jgi:molybdopterin converting factor subunit 1
LLPIGPAISPTSVSLQMVYLARLREAFGLASERLVVDGGTSVAHVLDVLRSRGGAWQYELAAGRAVRVAINHELAAVDATVAEGDEIALLPPVTGG